MTITDVEWFDSTMITRSQNIFPIILGDYKTKNTIQLFAHFGPQFLIQLNEWLRVTSSPHLTEIILLLQCLVIIDLSIGYECHALILVDNGLLATLGIHDCKSFVCQAPVGATVIA